MTSQMGTHMRSSREGVSGNNAMQFQSCDGSSYCTVLRENGCTDNLLAERFYQLPDFCMLRSNLQ